MGIFEDISSALNNTYKNNIPANIRMLTKSIVNPSPVTENNFTPSELDILRNSVDYARSNNKQGIQYQDYPETSSFRGSEKAPVSSSFLDPTFAMQTAIGKATFNSDNQGNMHLVDNYNFGELTPSFDYFLNTSPQYIMAERLGNLLGKPMPVNINLGQVQRKR